MKNVVVTGANGFIGQHLCRRLLESAEFVTACVRNDATSVALRSLAPSIRVCRTPSLCDAETLARALAGAEVVIHLAGRAHVMTETQQNPLANYRKANLDTTEALAKVAGKQRVRRFIYLSSIKVNGEFTTDTPFGADDPPGYTDPYGQSKWEAEVSLQKIAEDAGMEWVIIRPPLVYGPGAKGNFLSLTKSVASGVPLPVGSIRNQRSLVSVYNLAGFICAVCDHPRAANNRFVIADSYDISTPDLIRHIAVAFHRPARIFPCPEAVLRAAGFIFGKRTAAQRLCSSLVLDRHKVKRLLNWSASTTLDWGLDRTAEWLLKESSNWTKNRLPRRAVES